jgi:P4 family phage/plasmid primase-like protien
MWRPAGYDPFLLCYAFTEALVPRPAVYSRVIADKLGLIAEELRYGSAAVMIPPQVKRNDSELVAEKSRVALDFERELDGRKSPEEAYVPFKDRVIPYASSPLLNIDGEVPRSLFIENDRGGLVPDVRSIALWLRGRTTFACPTDTVTARGCELFRYVDGLYAEDGRSYVSAKVEAAARVSETSVRSSQIEEVVRAVARQSMVRRTELNPQGYLNLANGVLRLGSKDLIRHSPALRFTFKLPTRFVSRADCPRFRQFLEEVVPREKDRREIQKVFGYCFVPGNPYQIAHAFVGPGNNGKSTLIRVLTALLGPENVSAETLQSLESRFSSAKLYGKLLNAFADLPSNPLAQTSTFKMLTGGDQVRAELKFGAIFYFTNSAKLVFSANELPQVDDRTKAFWRRWQLIRFDQDFTGREDRHLLEDLTGELPGILNWALEGLGLLKAEDGFDPDLSGEGLKAEWQRRSDSLGWFAKEGVETDPVGWIAKEDFYEAYAEFCGANRSSTKDPSTVGKELPRHFPRVRTEKRRVDVGGPQVRGWRGIRLKATDPASPDSPASGRPAESSEAGEPGASHLSGGPGPDPGDLTGGRRTRADRARGRLGGSGE